MSKDTSCTRGKDVSLFVKGQIIDMYRAEKTSKETSEMTKNGLRTAQRIIKNWKGNIVFEEEKKSEKNPE